MDLSVAEHALLVAQTTKARLAGAGYAWTILTQAHEVGLWPSRALALIEQESNFQNVFGHDEDASGNVIFPGKRGQTVKVTKALYLQYKLRRGTPGRKGHQQGVGPAQLTWWEYQDHADDLGGCWIPRYNMRVAFSILQNLIDLHGERTAYAIYNGGATNPDFTYATEVQRKQARWHDVLA